MSDRHLRVESLIREIVAKYISQEANTNPLITITRVSISPDYHKATVFFTTIPKEKENDALIFMKRNGKEMRTFVKKNSNSKIIPFLEFMVDYGERHRQDIDEVVRKIEE